MNAKWMDQSKFGRAASILHPPTPIKYFGNISVVASPEGVRCSSAGYWKSKCLQLSSNISEKESDYTLEGFPGLLPYKKVKPKENIWRKITNVLGSLKKQQM